MDGSCFVCLALHAFAFEALEFEQAGVFDGDRDVSCESFEDLQLVVREGIGVEVIDGEDADDLAADLERKVDFRTRVGLTGDVIGVEGYVRGVAHLSGGGDVPDHALLADAEPVTFSVEGAAANAVEDHLVSSRVAQPHGDFDAAEGVGDVIDDALEQAIEIESRGDELRGTLQLHQGVNEAGGGING